MRILARAPDAGVAARGRGDRAGRRQGYRAPEVIHRTDKHQETVVAKHYYGPEERRRLLDKINRVAANLADKESAPEAAAEGPPAEGADETNLAELSA
jgi:hypothetical protein